MKTRSAPGAVKLAQASAAAPAKPTAERAKSAHAPSPPVKTKAAPTSTPSKSAPSAAKPRGRLTHQELFAAFREPFPRYRPRISYRAGILLISLTMVVLPLVYLAFIALVGFGVYYHAVNHTWLLEMGRGRSRAFVALVYAAPLIAGPIAVFFMFKPLLARPSRQERYRSLRRESEPLLFAFIDRICDEVGAPRPKRIDVDCTINAGAGFRRGLLSMF
ncbi:MAG TPA: hypothetical protein VHK01_09610, partial [Lacipirellulaceae bacterium]|nr:hypothetical protein [Lacipirellulaceae bacterium]